MLEEIIRDSVKVIDAENQPMFDTTIDYEVLSAKRTSAMAEWGSLDGAARSEFESIDGYLKSKGADFDLKDPNIIPAKNYSLLSREAIERKNSLDQFRLLALDGIDFDDSVIELAESLENGDEIRELYRLRKKSLSATKNAGINMDEAIRMKNCFSQGRELYISGRSGSLMVKPLNFFYAITAYSYGVIVLNNPLRYNKGNLPGSHGMGYLPADISAQFGGDTARGTFSDLFTSFPTQLVKDRNVEFQIDCVESVLEFYKKRFEVSVGTLLSMMPEMADYYFLTTGRPSRCHPLEIVNAAAHRSLTWEFHIGDGERRPDMKSIEDCFSGLVVAERHGKFVVTVPVSELNKLRACIYTDIRGKFWYVENPFFPVILPEICVHFLTTSIFSNIMRYRPDEWGGIILNDVKSNISLLTRHYFSSFQRKFFIVILRSISRYAPYVT